MDSRQDVPWRTRPPFIAFSRDASHSRQRSANGIAVRRSMEIFSPHSTQSPWPP